MTVTSSVSTIALRTFPIFQGLGDDRLPTGPACGLFSQMSGEYEVGYRKPPKHSRFAKGQSGNPRGRRNGSRNLKGVVSGEDGREVILTILGQGEMFGEMGVLDDSPRSASVVAVSPSDLVTIAKTDFKRLMQDNFELAWHVMCNLTRRLRDADRKIESLALMDVYGRVARLLLEMSEEIDGLKVVKKKISKQDIAKMIGASREMVSRVMKDLGLRGLIEETDGGIILREKIIDL